jgi:probable rRNA maturation factor
VEVCSRNRQRRIEVDAGTFGVWAAEILEDLAGSGGEASVVFVSDRRIRELNREYRGADRATDVLTFSLAGEPLAGGVLGDVYISAERARKQAEERGVSLEEEILRLLVHGLLHLVGHTHDGSRDTARMARLERKYGSRYAARARRSAGKKKPDRARTRREGHHAGRKR